MRKTKFAGLTQLDPAEPLALDNASFQARNPDLTDRYLEIGALTHRHDAHPALASPTMEASGTVVASGGAIPADFDVTLGYTLLDSYGGETIVADGLVLSTPLPYDPPFDEIVGSADYTGGQLLVGTYYYAVTLVDGIGGETAAGPHIAVERAPGFASARVRLGALTKDFPQNNAVGWRLYRAKGGQEFDLLATGATDTFTDDGTIPVNCDTHPPNDASNTTRGANKLLVVVPSGSAAVSSGAASFNLYGTLDGDFTDAFLVGNYPVSSAGQVIEIKDFDFPGQMPPDVSTCIAGAHKIDPDVELLDWHWKRPVASKFSLGSGDLGDVRMETNTGRIWGMLKAPSGATWTDWTVLLAPSGRRLDASASVSPLQVGASAVGGLDLAPDYKLYRISVSRPARVRLYAASAYQTADAGRPFGTDPTGDHGVMLDKRLGSAALSVLVAPSIDGFSLPPVDAIPLSVTNEDVASGGVTVSLHYRPLT